MLCGARGAPITGRQPRQRSLARSTDGSGAGVRCRREAAPRPMLQASKDCPAPSKAVPMARCHGRGSAATSKAPKSCTANTQRRRRGLSAAPGPRPISPGRRRRQQGTPRRCAWPLPSRRCGPIRSCRAKVEMIGASPSAQCQLAPASRYALASLDYTRRQKPCAGPWSIDRSRCLAVKSARPGEPPGGFPVPPRTIVAGRGDAER